MDWSWALGAGGGVGVPAVSVSDQPSRGVGQCGGIAFVQCLCVGVWPSAGAMGVGWLGNAAGGGGGYVDGGAAGNNAGAVGGRGSEWARGGADGGTLAAVGMAGWAALARVGLVATGTKCVGHSGHCRGGLGYVADFVGDGGVLCLGSAGEYSSQLCQFGVFGLGRVEAVAGAGVGDLLHIWTVGGTVVAVSGAGGPLLAAGTYPDAAALVALSGNGFGGGNGDLAVLRGVGAGMVDDGVGARAGRVGVGAAGASVPVCGDVDLCPANGDPSLAVSDDPC